MDVIQIVRTYKNKYARWDCKKQKDGKWNVHFWAVYSATIDWVDEENDLFKNIDDTMKNWVEHLNAKFSW